MRSYLRSRESIISYIYTSDGIQQYSKCGMFEGILIEARSLGVIQVTLRRAIHGASQSYIHVI